MANGTKGLMGKSYGSSVVGPEGIFGTMRDFEKSFTFAQRPEGMGITPQEMQNKARLLQEQQERKNFFQRQRERDEFQEFKREQEKQARRQSFLQGQSREQARTDAIQGLQNLADSFTVFGQTPSESQIDQLRSYVQRNIASGNLSADDFGDENPMNQAVFNRFGIKIPSVSASIKELLQPDKPVNVVPRPLGAYGTTRGASQATGQALNPFGNIPTAPSPAPQSFRPAGTLAQRGNSLFGSEGQFLGTVGGPSGNIFTPGLTNVDQMRMDRLNI